MKYKNGDKVKISNHPDLEHCRKSCSKENCVVKNNENEILTITLIKTTSYGLRYILSFGDYSSGCILKEEYFLPAMKWIRMK